MKPARKDETTLDLLAHEGLLDAKAVAQAQARARERGETPAEAAVADGMVAEKDVAKTLCKHLSLPYIDATRYFIKREIVEIMPLEFWEKNHVIPLDRIGRILIVAAADMLPRNVIEEVEAASNCDVRIYISTFTSLMQALRILKEQLQVRSQA
jgi:type IV pilus assembly protein PilB